MNHKTYTFDEAFKASLDYFTGDELAAKVWVNKYALKDAFGNIYEESPVDMHHRLASEIARVEKKYPNPLSEQELLEKLAELKQELFNLRFQHAINQLDNPLRMKAVKRDIARVKTFIRKQESSVQ